MFSALMLDPRVRTVLKGDRDKAVKELRLGPVSNLFCSADLTAATDRIPFELAYALWDGAISSGLLSEEDIEVLEYALGPQVLLYPDGKVIHSTCGILMGLPLSWVTLNLMQLFWADESARRAGEVAHPHDCKICGDDLVAHWSPHRIYHYEDVARSCYAKFSDGKHFKSRDRLVFTEILCEARLNYFDRLEDTIPTCARSIRGIWHF